MNQKTQTGQADANMCIYVLPLNHVTLFNFACLFFLSFLSSEHIC